MKSLSMQLNGLIDGLPILDFRGDPEVEVYGIAYDSRKVVPGGVFVALMGHSLDGHSFVEDALKKGVAAVVMESPLQRVSVPLNVKATQKTPAMVQVPNSREALAHMAKRFYQYPYRGIDLIGITGTNGKTTTSYLLESILLEAGRRPGIIGTISRRMPGQTWKAAVTTPESLDLMHTLRMMADENVTHVIMEVSSHALDQGRTRECPFRVAVFTNISRDHLDYHQSMDAYFEAKARLFRHLGQKNGATPSTAVINMDDPMGKILKGLTDAPVLTYGSCQSAEVRADNLTLSREGLEARLHTPEGEVNIHSTLMGDFDIYNIQAAAAAALSLGVPLDAIAAGIARLKGVPGRMERIPNSAALTVVVDYAHTPDALAKALGAMRKRIQGRVITVFGCGGDRDRGKRAEMGQVAGRLSDWVFITSDNPRTEDPAAIAQEVLPGVMDSGLKDYVLELDREKAISMAVQMARREDGVLIAGKGHEDCQIVGHESRPFDDRRIAAKAVSVRLSGAEAAGEDGSAQIACTVQEG
ncbi:MAG: UDP-N-acetylmuramoyl-L-alanyl-D-glutamate--2,6-diaminopimelate ligase [Thermodesulfobacteriota bacterium]